jgi:hypothetical protein
VAANPYQDEIKRNLPRLLALFDTDQTSSSYGMGDRYHWAWGLIDFGNGTFQGAAHGLARLWMAGLWPYPTPKAQFIARLDALFAAAKRLTRRDGSLEEAFPNEGSYCVTALVAFDLLCAVDLLHTEVDAAQSQRWRTIVAPMIGYLKSADETHALISNHLATAVAALLRWHRLAGDESAERKAREQLDKILQHQSEEGWFKEYEGADPGYQTLCTYYLADVHQLRPDWQLLEPLRRSIQFLWYFAHPDGSFAGLYGSRCTRFYYPAGVMALADDIPEAAALTAFMASSIAQQRVVTLSAMDEPNLVPMFNTYTWAAAMATRVHSGECDVPPTPTIPCLEVQPLRKYFPQAGLWLDRGPTHYTIINTHKGGVIYHFRQGRHTWINAGVVVRDAQGRYASSQAYDQHNSVRQQGEQLEITGQITAMPKQLPGPLQFLLLRLLCLTAFRSVALREWIKRRLVNMLITRRQRWPVNNLRTIHLGEALSFEDKTLLPAGYQRVESTGAFVPVHMASQGYWQIQDEQTQHEGAQP